MRTGRWVHVLLIALVVFGPLSCGKADSEKPLYPVRGQVLFKGKPTPGALVLFHPLNDTDPEAPRPHGRVDQEGRFTLTTYRAEDGAPAGDYVVTIDWRKHLPGHSRGGPTLLPPRYCTPKDSPLRAAVGAETDQLQPFQLSQ